MKKVVEVVGGTVDDVFETETSWDVSCIKVGKRKKFLILDLKDVRELLADERRNLRCGELLWFSV